jgi:hypothetical protein
MCENIEQVVPGDALEKAPEEVVADGIEEQAASLEAEIRDAETAAEQARIRRQALETDLIHLRQQKALSAVQEAGKEVTLSVTLLAKAVENHEVKVDTHNALTSALSEVLGGASGGVFNPIDVQGVLAELKEAVDEVTRLELLVESQNKQISGLENNIKEVSVKIPNEGELAENLIVIQNLQTEVQRLQEMLGACIANCSSYLPAYYRAEGKTAAEMVADALTEQKGLADRKDTRIGNLQQDLRAESTRANDAENSVRVEVNHQLDALEALMAHELMSAVRNGTVGNFIRSAREMISGMRPNPPAPLN